MALVATRQAMDQAGLPERLEGAEAEQTGAIIGSGLGGSNTLFDQIAIQSTRGPDRLSPFFIPMAIANMGSGQVAISFGAQGPNYATVSACATGGHAIGESAETILRGDAEAMLAGGTEAPITEGLVGAFAAMRALSTRNDDPEGASRPFDQGRDGFVIAEGAATLILEELGHAEARGARILAEVIGYGASADAVHITLPAPGGAGAVRAARRAIEKAGIDPSEVDHVNAHATSTPEGDPSELACFRTVFGEHAPEVSITATKSAIGHTLGAAGAIGSVAAIQALLEGCVPPTLNLTDPDPAVGDLDLTPLRARSRELHVALVNAFGFGGQNSVLVFRRWES
jgi:3-oxoacyl-[acyl-carrier-protein] synthase II